MEPNGKESSYVRFKKEQERLSAQAAAAKREFNKVTGLHLSMGAQFFVDYWPIALKALKDKVEADKAAAMAE